MLKVVSMAFFVRKLRNDNGILDKFSIITLYERKEIL